MRHSSIEQMLQALKENTSLDRLIVLFPEEWVEVDRELNELFQRGKPAEISAFMTETRKSMDLLQKQLLKNARTPGVVTQCVPLLIRGRMTFDSLNQRLHALLGQQDLGGGKGLSRYNHFLAKKVLRLSSVKRCPAPLPWMNFFWRFVTQKGTLVSLLEQGGSYCVFTAEFIGKLTELFDGQQVLEVGAGDGTLAKFLKNAGINIIATDDHSWSHKISFNNEVIRMSAAEALGKFSPTVVLCSWPPPGNTFERLIFGTNSVTTYVVIGSRHPFATSDREAYKKAEATFTQEEARLIARSLFPPEIDHEVLIFRRK